MTTKFSVSDYFEAHQILANKIDKVMLQKSIDIVRVAFESGRKIITCGNGGSASTASHFITDWNKMVNLATGQKFRGISLCDNIGLITAYGNDLSYEDVFSGQLAALADEGDLLIAISGSGNSPNVLRAVEFANKQGVNTLGIIGYDGGKLIQVVRHAFLVPSFDMQLCEDVHLMFGHMVMKELCGSAINN
jgi:D-sedoheptulose 7-phosphate isomerase